MKSIRHLVLMSFTMFFFGCDNGGGTAQPGNLNINAPKIFDDQIKTARQSLTVAESNKAILFGALANVHPDRLAIFIVPYTKDIASCAKTNLIFESGDHAVIQDLLKLLNAREDSDSKASVTTAETQKIVIALFSEGVPIAWLVATRNYNTVTVFYEQPFPDGQWEITGGKVVNDLEDWMRRHAIGFDVGGKPRTFAKPGKP